MENNRNVLVLL